MFGCDGGVGSRGRDRGTTMRTRTKEAGEEVRRVAGELGVGRNGLRQFGVLEMRIDVSSHHGEA